MNDFIRCAPGCCHAADVAVCRALAESWSFSLLKHWQNFFVFFPSLFSFPFRWVKSSQVQTKHKMSGPWTAQPCCSVPIQPPLPPPSPPLLLILKLGKNSIPAKENGPEREIDVTCETFVSVGARALLDFADGEKWTHEKQKRRFGRLNSCGVSQKTFD